MRTQRQKRHNKKQAQSFNRALVRKHKLLIPSSVLKALADCGLPPRKRDDNKKLRELLGST
jgi:hypothetical protein